MMAYLSLPTGKQQFLFLSGVRLHVHVTVRWASGDPGALACP